MEYNEFEEKTEVIAQGEGFNGEEITEEIVSDPRFEIILDILCVHSDKELRDEL